MMWILGILLVVIAALLCIVGALLNATSIFAQPWINIANDLKRKQK